MRRWPVARRTSSWRCWATSFAPLAPILTALQLLRLRGEQAGEREREIIERQVRHLVAPVDDLLDVSRITRGKVQLHRGTFEVSDAVARALETASPLLEQKRHNVEVDVPREGLAVDGDVDRLAQVIATSSPTPPSTRKTAGASP